MGAKGGKPPGAAEPQSIKQLRVQTSAYGNVIPLVYGETRVAGNILWAGYFKAIRHDQSSGTGKGGRVAIVQYTYTASVIVCLGERDRTTFVTDLGTATTGLTTTTTKDDGTQDEIVGATVGHGVWRVKKVRYAGDRLPDDVVRTGRVTRVGVGFSAWRYTPTQQGSYLSTSSETDNFFIKPDALPANSGFTGVQANNPNLQLTYPGLAVVEGQDIHLDSNAGFPNLNFPFRGLSPFLFHGIVDAHPRDIALDILTHPARGAGVPSNVIGDWGTPPNSWYHYCAAYDLLLSPVYDSQQTAAQILEELATMTNTAIVFSEGVLKMRPYGDEAQTSAKTGTSYDPATPTNPHGANVVNQADLTSDDFWHADKQPGVRIERKQAQQAFNIVHVEYLNAANAYAAEIAEAKDEADIQVHGPRADQPQRFHAIVHRTDTDTLARQVAQRLLQRILGMRDIYHFSLGFRHVLLEPMDVVTLTDPDVGLDHKPVRLTSITEDADGKLECEAEDFPGHVSESQVYLHQGAISPYIDYNAPASPTTDITVFEPPATLVNQAELWVLARGGDNWGGAAVFSSEDDAAYFAEGTLHAATVGTLLDAIAVQPTDDQATVARVLLAGDAVSRSPADAQRLRTLAYVGNGNAYELMGYSTLSLVAAVAPGLRVWQLKDYLRRGAYDRPIVTHQPGERVAILTDGHILALPIPLTLIGKTLYVKFVSFNVYGGGEQAIEDVDPVYVRVEGTYHTSPLPNVLGAELRFANTYALLTWDPVVTARQVEYEIRRGDSWNTAQLLGRTGELRFPVQGGGTYWIAAHYHVETGIGTLHAYSETPTEILVGDLSALVRNVVLDLDEKAEGWPGKTTATADAILGASVPPALYLPLSGNLDDWSGYDLASQFVVGGSGTAFLNQPGLVPGDSDGSIFLPVSAYLQSSEVGTHVETTHDLTMLLCFRRTSGAASWLWDSRFSATWATLSVSLDVGAALKLWRGTTLLLTIPGAVDIVAPHTVLVRVRHVDGTPNTQRRLEAWLDGSLIGQTDLTQSWVSYSRRSTIGAKFDGTFGLNGWVQAHAFWPAAVSDADVAAIFGAFAQTTGGLARHLDGSLRLTGTRPFSQIVRVDQEGPIWAAGGIAKRGAYYLEPSKRVTLRAVEGETRLTADLAGFAYFPWTRVNHIPAPFNAIAGLEGRLGDHVAVQAEVSTLPGVPSKKLAWRSYAAVAPRAYSALGFRERLVVTTDSPTVGGAVTAADLMLDVPDIIRQQQHVPVGMGLVGLLGTAAGSFTGSGQLSLTSPIDVPAGVKIVLVYSRISGGDIGGRADAIVQDPGGNTWVVEVKEALQDTGDVGISAFPVEALIGFVYCDMVTPLSAGDTLTITIPSRAAASTVGIVAAAFAGLKAGPHEFGLRAVHTFNRRRIFDGSFSDPFYAPEELPAPVHGGPGTYIFYPGTSPGLAPGSLVLSAFNWAGYASDQISAREGRLLGRVFQANVNTNLAPQLGNPDGPAVLYGLASDANPITLRATAVRQEALSYFGTLLGYAPAAPVDIPGSTVVQFSTPFNTDRPAVTVAIEDAQPGDTWQVLDVTATSFTIRVRNAAGDVVPRLISYVAKGY